jgi:acyl-CoA synthetase (AMP-forming)/AMP-acid ligase II
MLTTHAFNVRQAEPDAWACAIKEGLMNKDTTVAMVSGPPLTGLDTMLWVGDFARLAFIIPETGISITYAELDRRVGRMAAHFRMLGMTAGDRVAHYGRNSELYFVILIAAIRLGLVVVPLNWRCAEPEIAFFLQDSGARLVIADPDFMPIARSAAGSEDMAYLASEGAGGLRALLETDGEEWHDAIAWDSQTPCLQLYTSGTTGRPKGVLCTHRALSISRHMELTWDDFPEWKGGAIVSAMPNFHIGGKSFILMGLLRHSTCIVTADPSAANIVRLMADYGAHRTFIVPTVVRMFVDEVKARGITLPALESLFYGAAPMSPALLEDAIQTLGCTFVQYFGMTEITGTVTCLMPADHDLANPVRLTSVGRPYPGMAIEIRDADARPVGRDVAGEIWIRTPTVMRGYWNREEATADVLKDGWYKSGDGGRLDGDGYLFLTDRIKDMIVSGGENVYPGEVEEALRRFPGVYEVAVFGLPDPRWGESVAALVECAPGKQIDPAVLIDFARTQLAAFKCPKRIAITDALPRTASGKIQRAAAKAMMPG